MRSPSGSRPAGSEVRRSEELGGGRGAARRRIARTSPTPYYLQLFEILRDALEDNVWRVGEMIPSESELAATYGISRTVIRKALDRLVAAGMVRRLKGKRTIVQPPRLRFDVPVTAMQWAEHLASPTLGRVLDSSRVAAGALGTLLNVDADSEVFQITCLQVQAGRPVALTQLSLRTDASPALQQLAKNGGALEVVENGPTLRHHLEALYGVQTSRSEASIEPTTFCTEFEADQLDIEPHQAVFGLSSLTFNRDGEAVAFARTVFCTERSRIVFVIGPGQPLPGWD